MRGWHLEGKARISIRDAHRQQACPVFKLNLGGVLTRCKIDKPRLVGGKCLVMLEVADGLVGQILVEVVTRIIRRLDRLLVSVESWLVLRGLTRQETYYMPAKRGEKLDCVVYACHQAFSYHRSARNQIGLGSGPEAQRWSSATEG